MDPVLHSGSIKKIALRCITSSDVIPILDKTTTTKLTSMITEETEYLISSVISK